MIAEGEAWVLVPLIHFDRLAGAVLLARPRFDRRPDWEDFDMLRAAGRQAASYISEAQGQAALSDARRFEEFNRRFAFIMHDIKNLVSQLSLVTRNAERHANNPEFRADMVLTLKDSVGKMNDLLARLSQHHTGRADPPRAVGLRPIVEAVLKVKQGVHPILLSGDVSAQALADPGRLEQILLHLVQNAIDASLPGQPVTIGLGQRLCGELIVEVIDVGAGMTADFVAHELFQPFRSNKSGGFGIGAFEARSLAHAMGGRIEVQSREGEGSRFTLVLPPAHAQNLTDEAA
jgi:putative PEP-CTERM system histidine kinase